MHLVHRITLVASSAIVGVVSQAMFTDRVASYHPELLFVTAAVILFAAAADLPSKLLVKSDEKQSE